MFVGHTDAIWGLAALGPYLVSVSADYTARHWEVDSGQCLRVLRGPCPDALHTTVGAKTLSGWSDDPCLQGTRVACGPSAAPAMARSAPAARTALCASGPASTLKPPRAPLPAGCSPAILQPASHSQRLPHTGPRGACVGCAGHRRRLRAPGLCLWGHDAARVARGRVDLHTRADWASQPRDVRRHRLAGRGLLGQLRSDCEAVEPGDGREHHHLHRPPAGGAAPHAAPACVP